MTIINLDLYCSYFHTIQISIHFQLYIKVNRIFFFVFFFRYKYDFSFIHYLIGERVLACEQFSRRPCCCLETVELICIKKELEENCIVLTTNVATKLSIIKIIEKFLIDLFGLVCLLFHFRSCSLKNCSFIFLNKCAHVHARAGFCNRLYFTGWGAQSHAQPPTWRVRLFSYPQSQVPSVI